MMDQTDTANPADRTDPTDTANSTDRTDPTDAANPMMDQTDTANPADTANPTDRTDPTDTLKKTESGYIMGIDGGGTKTLLKIAGPEGNLLASCQSGPTNLYSGSTDTVRENLEQAIQGGLAQAQIRMEDLGCVSLGMAGADRPQDHVILKELLAGIGIRCRILITNDAVAALYGALGKGEGIILVSGTGSICYGQKADGSSHRAGGWGHIIGDEGSGYDIGRQILMEVMKSYDGRREKTILSSLLRDEWNLPSPESMLPFVYHSESGKSDIAALGVLLDPACEAGDPAALCIARNAARELFLCVESVLNALRFPENRTVLAMQGGVLVKGKQVKKELTCLLNHAYPMVCIRESLGDAAWGAIQMAAEKQSGSAGANPGADTGS